MNEVINGQIVPALGQWQGAILIIVTLVSVFRNPDVSGGEKAVWVVATIVFPFLGSLVYFPVRRGW